MGRCITGRIPPEDEKRALEAHLAPIRVQGWWRAHPLRGEWRGKYYIVLYGGHPVCRMAYTGDEEGKWECAIYRPTRDAFGTDGFLFPLRGDPRDAVQTALGAFNYQCVQ